MAMRERGIILTEGVVLGLFFVQRYRFLTIDQFARAAGMHRDTASRQLRSLELRGVLSHFGNACLPGHGRTPKVYFLTLLDLMDSEYPFGLNIFECRDAADINEVAKTSKKDMGRAPASTPLVVAGREKGDIICPLVSPTIRPIVRPLLQKASDHCNFNDLMVK